MDLPDVNDTTRLKYPPGTPEYEAYRDALNAELALFAAGAAPYRPDRPAPTAPLVEDGAYRVTTSYGSRIVAFYKPIDGIRANHPWVGEDETRHRSDAVTDIRPVIVVDPEVALHQVTAMIALGDATPAEIIAAITMGTKS